MARGLLAPILGLLAFTSAQKTYLQSRDSGKAVTFQGSEGFSFSMSASGSDGDIYFRLEGPSSNGWIGVGIGSQMAGALVFIAYASGENNGVTVSQRIATGQTQPQYAPEVQFQQTGKNKLIASGATFLAEGVCKNCSTWDVPGGSTGSIDFTSTQQPFIYALGPNQSVANTSKSADLEEHSLHGTFAIDMTLANLPSASVPSTPKATAGSAPLPSGSSSAGVTTISTSESDSDSNAAWTRWCHILFGLFGLIIFFPAGAVWLRVVGSVRMHYLNNLLGTVCVVVGAGIGIWWSKQIAPQYGYKAPHQIVGLIILALTLLQVALGALHHMLYKRAGRPTPWGLVHRLVGVVVVCLGISQGFSGFAFADNIDQSWPLAIVIIVWVGGCVGLVAWKRLKDRKMTVVEKRLESPRSLDAETSI